MAEDTLSTKEYNRKYHEAHRDQIRERHRAYYQKNKERIRERAKKWHSANRDRILARMRDWHENNKDRRLGRARKRRYNITPERFNELFASQGFGCAICGTSAVGTRHGWHVDHCHTTKKVRGVLCHNCNCGLGMAKESIEILRKMAEYIECHNGPAAKS